MYLTGTESQINLFEKKFEEVVFEAQTEVELSHDIDSLSVDLNFLPTELLERLEGDRVLKIYTRQLFHYLTLNYCNFLEYKILQILIESKCSENLKEKMSSYANSIENFKKRATVTEFIIHGSHLMNKRILPSHFKSMVLEHAFDPDMCTLSELDAFRRDILIHLKRLECYFQIYRIEKGSVVVKWMIDEMFVASLNDFFHSKIGQRLLCEYQVIKIVIDDILVPLQPVSTIKLLMIIAI